MFSVVVCQGFGLMIYPIYIHTWNIAKESSFASGPSQCKR